MVDVDSKTRDVFKKIKVEKGKEKKEDVGNLLTV